MRLIDCFTETISYTLYLLRNLDSVSPSYETVRQDYLLLLTSSDECVKPAGFSEEAGESAKFAVCAWVDESILCSSWEGKENWQKEQLQRIHFQTNHAGEEFFLRLEKLEPEDRSVREVYATCLGLGFTGRYYREDQKPVLEDLKRKNLNLLMETLPEELGSPEGPLFPGAYTSLPIGGKRPGMFKSFDAFTAFFLIVPILLLGALYLSYQKLLDKMVYDFFGSVF